MTQLSPTCRRVCRPRALFYLVILWIVATGAVRAQSDSRPPLLPRDAVFAAEIDRAEDLLSAFARAGRLFRLRPGADAAETALPAGRGDWRPYLPAASALMYTLELPYEERIRRALAAWLEQTRGRMAFGLVPEGSHGIAPVLALTLRPGRRPEPAAFGIHMERAGEVWIISPSRGAAERVRGYCLRSTGAGEAVASARGGHRIRWNLGELMRRRPWTMDSTLAVFRHFIGLSPASVEVRWTPGADSRPRGAGAARQGRFGQETVHLGLGALADCLALDPGAPAPRYVYCSLRFGGRLRLPEGLEAIAGFLQHDPLGIHSALARSWPVRPPDLLDLARDLTGRFQILVLHGGSQFVPVVGLEVANPDRALLRLGRLLVESGVCERHQSDPVPYTFPRRLPYWLRGNGMLRIFFRHYSRPRDYQVALVGGWAWMGPKREMDRVLMALREEQRAEKPDVPADVSGTVTPVADTALGRIELNPAPFWNDLVYERGVITSDDEDEEDEVLRRLREARRELAGEVGLFAYAAGRDGDRLVLSRPIQLRETLLTVLAARAYRSFDAIWADEQQTRRAARLELAALHRARLAFRRQRGRAPASLEELSAADLWRPDPEGSKRYAFGLVASGSAPERPGSLLYAVPVAVGPAGPRPAYLMGTDGQILVGETGPGGAIRLPGGDPGAEGWRPADAD